MNEQESEQTLLLREILKWIRFAGAKEVKSVLNTTLDTDQKRMIYQLSDGIRGSVEISKVAGVSDWTVRNYWKIWSKSGIMESLKAGRGDRYKRSFDLEDFGIEIPKTSTNEAKRDQAQETLSPQDETDNVGGLTNE